VYGTTWVGTGPPPPAPRKGRKGEGIGAPSGFQGTTVALRTLRRSERSARAVPPHRRATRFRGGTPGQAEKTTLPGATAVVPEFVRVAAFGPTPDSGTLIPIPFRLRGRDAGPRVRDPSRPFGDGGLRLRID
jgi:hypothetical protein